MTTWTQIVNLALRDSGVAPAGLTPNAQMQQDALFRMQMMIDEWRANRLYVYHLVDLPLICTDGKQSYTVGPGGDFNVPREPNVEDAFLRQVVPSTGTPVDFPLFVTRTRQDYDQIRLKSLRASPSSMLFYDAGWPLGAVYPWPIPSSNFELHIIMRAVLDNYWMDPTLTINLPNEYNRAIYANLVVNLCAAHRKPVHKVFERMATVTMKTIKRANTQVPLLQQPQGLTRGPKYNIFSDQGG